MSKHISVLETDKNQLKKIRWKPAIDSYLNRTKNHLKSYLNGRKWNVVDIAGNPTDNTNNQFSTFLSKNEYFWCIECILAWKRTSKQCARVVLGKSTRLRKWFFFFSFLSCHRHWVELYFCPYFLVSAVLSFRQLFARVQPLFRHSIQLHLWVQVQNFMMFHWINNASSNTHSNTLTKNASRTRKREEKMHSKRDHIHSIVLSFTCAAAAAAATASHCLVCHFSTTQRRRKE